MSKSRFQVALLAIVAVVAITSLLRIHGLERDYRALSTTKVDNLDIAGTTQATGLVTATTGVNGATVYATTPDLGEPAFRAVRSTTAPGSITAAQWRFGYSNATTAMIWKYWNGAVSTGPWMTLSTAGNLTIPGLFQSNTASISNNADVLGLIKLGPSNTTTLSSGTGTPEGVVTAPVGSVFTRENGAALTTLYVKESGAGNTGWKPYANTDVFTSAVNGLTPASGGGTANYLRADGTWAAPPGTGGAAMTVSISKSATSAGVNLSTEGTVDYLYMTLNNPYLSTTGAPHAPANRGGDILQTWRWRPNSIANATAADASGNTFTTTATDDQNPAGISSNTYAVYFNSSNTTADMGWTFRIPSRGTGTRRIRIYAANRDDTITVTATPSDGVTPASTTNVTGAYSRQTFEILFTGPVGTFLQVSGQASAGTANFPIYGIAAVTVADI